MKEHESIALGELGLSPHEFERLTYGEYLSKLKGYQMRCFKLAQLIGLGFNDPRRLNELIMLLEALNRGEG